MYHLTEKHFTVSRNKHRATVANETKLLFIATMTDIVAFRISGIQDYGCS